MKALMWLGFVLGAVSAADKVITARVGQSVSLVCETQTSYHSLTWDRENSMIWNIMSNGITRKGSIDVQTRSKLKGTDLEINPVKKQDAGKFTCLAASKSQVYTLLVVSVSASPTGELQEGSNAKLLCEVEGLPENSAVQWKRPDGSPQTGSKEVHLNPVTIADEGTWVCKFTYNNEEYSEDLLIKVKVPTSTSAPIQSTKVVHKCPNCGTDPTSGAGKIDWMVWLIVGVCSLVLIVLVVFVVVLSRRIRMRKRKRSGRQSLRPKKYCKCNCPTAAAKPQQGRQKGKPSDLPLRPQLME